VLSYHNGGKLASISKVALCWDRLVVGWAHIILAHEQPLRSTQPGCP